jgi:DNA topoisomerase-1
MARPEDAARAAQLRYVSDRSPGIARRGSPSRFSCVAPDGLRLRDAATLHRIRKLSIPPAWTDVWICRIPNGHLQATGRDARGRKQYRYHARWRVVRDANKHGRLRSFGGALAALRDRVSRDLATSGFPREKVVAMVVQLLATTFARVGNESYARSNGSFGLTTLQNRHLKPSRSGLRLRSRGKSGVMHDVAVTDRRLARLVRRCRELPGQDLFQYIGADGEPEPVTSADVNAYLQDTTGSNFTAIDFRTGAGSLLALRFLAEPAEELDEAPPKSFSVEMVKTITDSLGNTPSVCRTCFIHPAVLETPDNAAARVRIQGRAGSQMPEDEGGWEAMLLQLLEACDPCAPSPEGTLLVPCTPLCRARWSFTQDLVR